MHQGTDLLAGLLLAHLYLWLFGWRLLEIDMGAMSFIALMVLQDFATTGFIVLAIACAGCGLRTLSTTALSE